MSDLHATLPFGLRLAGLGFAIGGGSAGGGVLLPAAYHPFLDPGPFDFELTLGREEEALDPAARVFDCPPIWSLYRGAAASVFSIYPDFTDLRRTLAIPIEGRAARLSFLTTRSDPFLGPAMELLFISRLGPRQGLMLHGCGIDRDGRGTVFAGESGAGKTTLARLWAARGGIGLLSDDRVVVRRQNDGFRLYGTPWHGEARFGLPGGVPLDRILFIRHGEANALRTLGRAAAAAELLKCSFPPYWDAAGMAQALELLSRLTDEVPCAELAFIPDESVIACIEKIAG